jgi:integrase
LIGPTPFLTLAKRYIIETRSFYSQSTIKERLRKYPYLGKVFTRLKREGMIDTVDPRKIGEREIIAFIEWMDSQDLGNSTKKKYLELVDGLCAYNGNHIVKQLKTQKRIRPYRREKKKIRHLKPGDFPKIANAAKNVPGWNGSVLYHGLILYYALGLRPSELVTQEIKDVDMQNEIWTVSHPKGEEAGYGSHREVGIPPWAMIALEEFLDERDKYLAERGVRHCKWLIPSVRRNKVVHFSVNFLRVMKQEIEKETGIQFSLKDFRSSAAMELRNTEGMDIETVSSFLGHNCISTTYQYYARLKDVERKKQLKKAQNTRDFVI